jgi:hypothetical protein
LKRPAVAAATTGAEIVGTALAFGAAETLLAVVAAYTVYRLVEERVGGRSPARRESDLNR